MTSHIEREFKFVLDNKNKSLNDLLKHIGTSEFTSMYIEQGYLSNSARVRSINWLFENGKFINELEYLYTYKHKLKKEHGVMEIETDISEEAFNLLWEDSDSRITKYRVILNDSKKESWMIDYFVDEYKLCYLIMAECEVYNRVGYPENIPDLIKDSLIYTVEENDTRFKNKKLSDITKVHELLIEISK